MLKLINIVISTVLVCLLSACASMNNTAKTEEQDQKIKTAKINAQLGIAYLERHNIQRSKQKLLLALEQGPNIPETWYSMAYFLEATGNKDDASIYYQKAISVAPTRGDAQNNYGTFLCRSGDYRGAVEHFMVAVKDPTYLDPADAYENAGLCAMKIPDKTMAAKYFAQALQQDPSRMVSERKLRELNKYLAMNDASDEEVPVVAAITPAPKRIAYNSLKQRHQEEENEDDVDSGLVKVPDLLKASPVAAAATEDLAPASVIAHDALADAARAKAVRADAARANAVPVPIKAVYRPAPKPKSKTNAKTVTAQAAKRQAKSRLHANAQSVAVVNPLTKEKFHVERVSLNPAGKKKVALNTRLKHVKPAKLALKQHKKSLASAAKHHAKVKVAHAAVRKHEKINNTVTV